MSRSSLAPLLLAGLLVPPPLAPAARGQSPDAATGAATGAAVRPLSDHVPASARFVATLEVKTVLGNPQLGPLGGFLRGPEGPGAAVRRAFGVGLDEVDSLALALATLDAAGPGGGTLLLRTTGPVNAAAVADRPGLSSPGPRTLALSQDPAPDGGPPPPAAGPGGSAGAFPLNAAAGADAVLTYDLAPVRPLMLARLERLERATNGPAAGPLGLVEPLAERVNRAGAALTLGAGDGADGGMTLVLRFETDGPAEAAEVAAALRGGLDLAEAFLANPPPLAPDGEPGAQVAVTMTLGLARALLSTAAIETDGGRVTLTVKGDATIVAVGTALILPAVQQARAAARRAQSQNNLKQLVLSLYNYEDRHGHFPPAVVVENGVARSWRVELLPWLDERDLYDAYRKDQPWDSAANKKVLARMPETFRHPADDRDGFFTSYFAPVGSAGGPAASAWVPEAGPDGGATFADLRDGLTTTILVVEANRPAPWTKPEDLPLDPTRPVDPRAFTAGGWNLRGFQAAMADGSAQFFGTELDPAALRALLTRAGGEPEAGDAL